MQASEWRELQPILRTGDELSITHQKRIGKVESTFWAGATLVCTDGNGHRERTFCPFAMLSIPGQEPPTEPPEGLSRKKCKYIKADTPRLCLMCTNPAREGDEVCSDECLEALRQYFLNAKAGIKSRTCTGCGRIFYPKEPGQWICHEACNKEAVKPWKEQTRHCLNCGKEFKPKKRASRYCCEDCERTRRQRFQSSKRRMFKGSN